MVTASGWDGHWRISIIMIVLLVYTVEWIPGSVLVEGWNALWHDIMGLYHNRSRNTTYFL